MSFEIQPASLWDVHAIHLLEKEVFYSDAYPSMDLAFLFLTPGTIHLKAVTNATPLAGYICGAKGWLRLQPAWIVTLCVAPAYQRQGIGRALLAACEAKMNFSRVRLTVREKNYPAIRLYENTGYVYLFTRQRYYRDGENGLVMEKKSS